MTTPFDTPIHIESLDDVELLPSSPKDQALWPCMVTNVVHAESGEAFELRIHYWTDGQTIQTVVFFPESAPQPSEEELKVISTMAVQGLQKTGRCVENIGFVYNPKQDA